jgi:hypothetical protein
MKGFKKTHFLLNPTYEKTLFCNLSMNFYERKYERIEETEGAILLMVSGLPLT